MNRPNHVHINGIGHELGQYAVILIGPDGKIVDHIFLGHPEHREKMDLAVLNGERIKLGAIDILTGDEAE